MDTSCLELYRLRYFFKRIDEEAEKKCKELKRKYPFPSDAESQRRFRSLLASDLDPTARMEAAKANAEKYNAASEAIGEYAVWAKDRAVLGTNVMLDALLLEFSAKEF